jgi:ATP-dependent RNA helicase DDX35
MISTYLVYNAFVKYGREPKWCQKHFLNYKALLRAVSIRKQLTKYMKRFGVELHSCGERAYIVQRCLTSGFFAHAAHAQPDGTYRTLRDDMVSA